MDYVIIKVRRRLLAAAKAMAQGIEPEAPWHPEEYRWHRETLTLQGVSLEEAAERAKEKAGERRAAREQLERPPFRCGTLEALRVSGSALVGRWHWQRAALDQRRAGLHGRRIGHALEGRQRARHEYQSRHADGRALPALLAAGRAVGGAAGPGLHAARSRSWARSSSPFATRWPRRPLRRLLPTSRRTALLRPQRGVRPALRLPRLEVRRRAAPASICPRRRRATRFKDKIHIKAYPCVEVAGMVFAYMGPADKQPPFPEFEWAKLPQATRYVSKFRLECNYLQAMEGDYDPSHASFLHSTLQDVRIPNPLDTQLGGTATESDAADEPRRFKLTSRSRSRSAIDASRRKVQAASAALEDTPSAVLSDRRARPRRRPQGRRAPAPSWMMPIYCTAGIVGPRHLLQQHAHPDRQREPHVLPAALEIRADPEARHR